MICMATGADGMFSINSVRELLCHDTTTSCAHETFHCSTRKEFPLVHLRNTHLQILKTPPSLTGRVDVVPVLANNTHTFHPQANHPPTNGPHMAEAPSSLLTSPTRMLFHELCLGEKVVPAQDESPRITAQMWRMILRGGHRRSEYLALGSLVCKQFHSVLIEAQEHRKWGKRFDFACCADRHAEMTTPSYVVPLSLTELPPNNPREITHSSSPAIERILTPQIESRSRCQPTWRKSDKKIWI